MNELVYNYNKNHSEERKMGFLLLNKGCLCIFTGINIVCTIYDGNMVRNIYFLTKSCPCVKYITLRYDIMHRAVDNVYTSEQIYFSDRFSSKLISQNLEVSEKRMAINFQEEILFKEKYKYFCQT